MKKVIFIAAIAASIFGASVAAAAPATQNNDLVLHGWKPKTDGVRL